MWGLNHWTIVGGVALSLIYVGTAGWIGLRIRKLGRQRYDFKRQCLV